MSTLRKFGPRTAEALTGLGCPACGAEFVIGDYTTLIALGPGPDPLERKRARGRLFYNAVAVEVHWACATGETDTDSVSVSGPALPGPAVDLSGERPGGTVNAPRRVSGDDQ